MIQSYNRASFATGVPGLVLYAAGGALGAALIQLAGGVLFLIGLAHYAMAKGRSRAWCLLGIVPILGLVVLALLRDESGGKVRPLPGGTIFLVVAFVSLIAIVATLALVAGRPRAEEEPCLEEPARTEPTAAPREPWRNSRPERRPTPARPPESSERRVANPRGPLVLGESISARIERFPEGARAIVSLSVGGCALDAEGRTDLALDLTLLDPEGEAVFERSSLAVLRRRCDEDAGAGPIVWEVSVELLSAPPAGEYEAWIVIRDRLRNENAFKRTKSRIGGDPAGKGEQLW